MQPSMYFSLVFYCYLFFTYFMQKISMPTSYGGIPDIINDLLSFVGSQFTPSMLAKLSDPTLGTFLFFY